MNVENKAFSTGDQVWHEQLGLGRVELDKEQTVLVRFEGGIEDCEKASLTCIHTPLQALEETHWHAPLEVVTRTQAEAIQSANDMWGVFSQSRIELLPHQLWVCRRVLESWPTRWLIADDVGLGKTIEAGLILLPLLSRRTVRRVLILCPSSLVEQWMYRFRTMFDIRCARYVTQADTEKTDFWETNNQVIASLQTLRADLGGRHKRLLESPPWDLLIIDEAHHLNADEDTGQTLGYKLVEKMVDQKRAESMLFFTGTPHRGKNFGFLSLLQLLRPEWFNPRHSLTDQLGRMRDVIIRNNKQNVTDLKGERLFFPPDVQPVTYSYSAEEALFYEMLTEFIATGKAYASALGPTDQRAVMLVLISMQKLAPSSVAAIKRALVRRLGRISESREKLSNLKAQLKEVKSLVSKYEDSERLSDTDVLNTLEEQVGDLSVELRLMEDEEPRLKELINGAKAVTEETKINKIVSILLDQFKDQPVLFFTEYKATQSLLMSALIEHFGEGCVTFINGDDRADDVVDASGEIRTYYENRAEASDKFNGGETRFLVSTEAGGEGIDLQESCHCLVHVDLPWNPMRLHQRVGRLNRYGQKHPVEVRTIRNPDTVESRIWDKLNAKMQHIMTALGSVMDEPEDLLQLVLGMESPSLFRELFAEGAAVPADSLSDWFDAKTARFGGRDALETVKSLVGNCSKFDFKTAASQIPKADLPALRPFFISMLKLNRRMVREELDGLSFLTPESWLTEPAIRDAYEAMIFDRQDRSKDAAQRILGVGNRLFDKALGQARTLTASVASLPGSTLKLPIVIFRIQDRVTNSDRNIQTVTVGIEISGELVLLRDWELLERLNAIIEKGGLSGSNSKPSENIALINDNTDKARSYLEAQLPTLELPFKIPQVELHSMLWPIKK